ncbi:MAG: S1 RNA-binding domain-containing protein [Chloroflexi bacterium]|nr:S1 RNA-binding domain-containing protein [Chloroflexota bacterium]
MDSSVEATVDRNEIKSKMRFTGTVLKTGLAGALVDIGTGTPAVIHISQIAGPTPDEPVKRVEDVLQPGQSFEVWVKKVKGDRVELTMIKPLDLEWREIKKDMVVKGTVTRLEKFGAFVEIGAERPGLVHISEMAHGYVRSPSDVVKEGDEVEAQVLEVNRRKKQIKLSIKALQPEPEPVEEVVRPASMTDAPSHRPSNQQGPKEKPARRKKTPRKSSEMLNGDFNFDLDDAAPAEAEPTAMEIALREAMEKAKTRKQQQEEKNRKAKAGSKEQDDLLSRTLENKPSAS